MPNVEEKRGSVGPGWVQGRGEHVKFDGGTHSNPERGGGGDRTLTQTADSRPGRAVAAQSQPAESSCCDPADTRGAPGETRQTDFDFSLTLVALRVQRSSRFSSEE